MVNKRLSYLTLRFFSNFLEIFLNDGRDLSAEIRQPNALYGKGALTWTK